MNYHRLSRSRKQRSTGFASTLSRIATTTVSTVGVVLGAQAIYVGMTTPRLTPPPLCGKNFEKDGLVVSDFDDDSGCGDSDDSNYHHTHFQNQNEIRVILLGDSPVEGIGNDSHDVALGGQTAYAISRTLRKPVRYWSLGKSGLTAAGIEKEMVPLMKEISKEYNIDLVVVSAGVNNILSGHTSTLFENELNSLLHSIQECRLKKDVPIILLGLLDFSHMPFLPFPLSGFAGWRSRKLQQALIAVADRWVSQRIVDIAYMPDVHEVLKKKEDHSLLSGVLKDDLKELEIDDFFADDGFHPARYGTIMLGNLIAQTLKDIIIIDDE